MGSVWKRVVEHGIALLFNEEDGVSVPIRDAPVPPPPRKPTGRAVASSRKDRTIHRVRQKYSTSCGVAVVGMFARVSHEDAMRVMFPTAKQAYYTHYTDVKRALDHFGVKHGGRVRRFTSWSAIPSTAIVKVKWKEEGRVFFHWVIFQKREDGGGHVLDPSPASKDTQRLSPAECRRYTGLTYLTVDPIPPRQPRVKKGRSTRGVTAP